MNDQSINDHYDRAWKMGYSAAIQDAIHEVERLSNDENCLVMQCEVTHLLKALDE